MRGASIFLIALLLPLAGGLIRGNDVPEGDAVRTADSSAVAHGRVVPMKGAFLASLHERDSVLIADQLRYGFELRMVEEGTEFVLPQWQNNPNGGVMAVSSWTEAA